MREHSDRRATLCVTFDNMGRAQEVGAGMASLPDAAEPSLAKGYERILTMLEQLGLKATFFIEGWNCLHHAARIQELVARGHEVGLHGWIHETFHRLDARTVEQLLSDGRAAMQLIGIPTRLFRAPGGIRGAHTQPALERLGFTGDSSVEYGLEHEQQAGDSYAVGQPHLLSGRLATVPWRWDAIDYIHYRILDRNEGAPDRLRARWTKSLDLAEAHGTTLTIIAHAFISGVDDARLLALADFLDDARRRPSVRCETVGTITERLLSKTDEVIG